MRNQVVVSSYNSSSSSKPEEMEIEMGDAFPASEGEDFTTPEVEENNELSQLTFKGDWEKVVKVYKSQPLLQISVINSSRDTALHMAINDDTEDFVEELVGSIVNNQKKQALTMQNNRGETPLHRAATRKSVKMCQCILEKGQQMGLDLLSIANKWGETPIFTAALYDRKPVFLFLHDAAKDAYPQDIEKPYQFLRRTDGSGDTALHSVIRREHFDLAFHMIKLYPDLVGKYDVKGMTPLHVLASKPSAFRSGVRLSWWKQIIYYCIRADKLKYDPRCTFTLITSATKQEDKCPKNYLTCYQFLWGAYSAVKKIKEYWSRQAKSSGGESGGKKKGEDPEAPNNSYANKNIPQNYTTLYELLVFVYLTLSHFSGLELIVNKIREDKEKHEWSVQILKALMEKYNTGDVTAGRDPRGRNVFDPRQQKSLSTNVQVQKDCEKNVKFLFEIPTEKFRKCIKGGDTDKETEETHTPLLVAAQNGVIEVVHEILSKFPVTVYETTSKDKNILQVAVENRQPSVIEAVQEQVNKESKLNLWADLIKSVDTDENTILHLAAKYEKPNTHPWQIHGTAMQMQWEITWYEYVKSLSPHHFLSLSNKQGQTPEQIFTKGHEDLVKESSEWLKDTSESCSVVAALVAGVSFATSSQVPGGTNHDTGKPSLEHQPAFELFAITALIGLCFSVTALIMFLSILTSRKLPRDFRRTLPLKILLGLSSLFVSIASMLVSFCAAHFFVLEDRFKKAVFPLYAATCLPVSFYAIVQFPLYMDLLKSIITQFPQSRPSGHV
ncbi:hypothetical protein QN277_012729 [Acacia crassicarpa]|uniref:PGG domain-containing protein n=1 Tax=Acacia crassicarpa TaxID=499986 RepID=A0AAE1TDC0_9FABA|nr:hypothetical protein QN277_012729 [Acacia crassicarpa]